jgi:hypothetical protein
MPAVCCTQYVSTIDVTAGTVCTKKLHVITPVTGQKYFSISFQPNVITSSTANLSALTDGTPAPEPA